MPKIDRASKPHDDEAEPETISETPFRVLVEHSSDILGIVHREGELVYASPVVERLLGCRGEEGAPPSPGREGVRVGRGGRGVRGLGYNARHDCRRDTDSLRRSPCRRPALRAEPPRAYQHLGFKVPPGSSGRLF